MVALRDGDPREREQWINGIINNGGSIADAMMAGLLMRMEGDVQQDKKYSDSTTLVGCRLMDCSRLMVFLSPLFLFFVTPCGSYCPPVAETPCAAES